jgi:hypothetical protein
MGNDGRKQGRRGVEYAWPRPFTELTKYCGSTTTVLMLLLFSKGTRFFLFRSNLIQFWKSLSSHLNHGNMSELQKASQIFTYLD